MNNKFEAKELKDGTIYVYENGTYIGTLDQMNFPIAGFARIMRAANNIDTELASLRAENEDLKAKLLAAEHNLSIWESE